jgi:hypothetical protein
MTNQKSPRPSPRNAGRTAGTRLRPERIQVQALAPGCTWSLAPLQGVLERTAQLPSEEAARQLLANLDPLLSGTDLRLATYLKIDRLTLRLETPGQRPVSEKDLAAATRIEEWLAART